MDYKAVFKEKLSKLLFLEVDWDGFKRSTQIPENISLKTKDLYIPISSKYITNNINNEIKINNLPIYYFIEGMLIALGADEKLSYSEDYIKVLKNIKESEDCGRGLVANRIKEDNLMDAYLLIKGLFLFTYKEEYYKKLLLVGEALIENDSAFGDILLKDIEVGKEEFNKMSEPYLYKALFLKKKGDFIGAKVEINQYLNKGGEVTPEIKEIIRDIDNIATYEEAIALLDKSPEQAIEMFLGLTESFKTNPLIYYYLAVASRKIEKYEEAIYYLNESLAIETGILEVVTELGINYACLGSYKNAIKYFKKGFEASKDVETCTNIVMCYLNMGDEKEAKLNLEIAKRLNPEDEIVQQIDRMFAK